MSEVDLVILVVIVIAVLVGALRGFHRESLSLLIWLASILITLVFTSRVATILPIDQVSSGQTRATLSALVLFGGTLLTGNLCSWVLDRARARKPLSSPDRVIGAVFAVARSMVMLTLLVLALNLVPDLQRQNWWRDSQALPVLQQMAQFIHVRLPDGTWQHFDFPPTGN